MTNGNSPGLSDVFKALLQGGSSPVNEASTGRIKEQYEQAANPFNWSDEQLSRYVLNNWNNAPQSEVEKILNPENLTYERASRDDNSWLDLGDIPELLNGYRGYYGMPEQPSYQNILNEPSGYAGIGDRGQIRKDYLDALLYERAMSLANKYDQGEFGPDYQEAKVARAFRDNFDFANKPQKGR